MKKRELKRMKRRMKNKYPNSSIVESSHGGDSAHAGISFDEVTSQEAVDFIMSCIDDENAEWGTFGDNPMFIYNDISGETENE